MGWFRISIAGLIWLVLTAAVGLASLRFASPSWAGVVLLMTLGVLTLAILGIACRRGVRRISWLGFALLGWGYMMLASGSWWDRSADRPELITSTALDLLFARYRDDRLGRARSGPFGGLGPLVGDREILAQLARPISMPFQDETSLEDVLKYIKSATKGSRTPGGIPIYVDPRALQEAEKTMHSPVRLSLEGVPLRTTLGLLLDQLDLSYRVEDRLLTIGAKPSRAPERDAESFRRIGHCLFALAAAFIGWIAGRLFYVTRAEDPDSCGNGESRAMAHP